MYVSKENIYRRLPAQHDRDESSEIIRLLLRDENIDETARSEFSHPPLSRVLARVANGGPPASIAGITGLSGTNRIARCTLNTRPLITHVENARHDRTTHHRTRKTQTSAPPPASSSQAAIGISRRRYIARVYMR